MNESMWTSEVSLLLIRMLMDRPGEWRGMERNGGEWRGVEGNGEEWRGMKEEGVEENMKK